MTRPPAAGAAVPCPATPAAAVAGLSDPGLPDLAGPVGFDLDLTLIDSRPAILAAWSEVARETGVPVDLAAVDRRMGLKLEDEAAHWFPAGQIQPAAAAYRRHYARIAPGLTAALPGAREAIAAVRAAGTPAVVITAKHPVSVGPSMHAAGLTVPEIFTLVHGPEKAAVLTRIRAALYVGDTPADMTAARASRTRAVGVPTGSYGPAELLEAGAHLVLGSLREFPDWYAALRRGG